MMAMALVYSECLCRQYCHFLLTIKCHPSRGSSTGPSPLGEVFLLQGRLCENYINSDKEEISSIFYFSAIATWHHDQSNPQKHNRYISRLRQENVIPVLGKFKEKTIRCKVCSSTFKSHEEKRTDVNIALKMVSEAVLGTYDTAILVSGDTDIIPAISTIRDLSLQKRRLLHKIVGI